MSDEDRSVEHMETGGPLAQKCGIRSGRGLLYRGPFAPWHKDRQGRTLSFLVDGKPVPNEIDSEGYRRPDLARIDGDVVVAIDGVSRAKTPTIAANGRATRHITERLKEFEDASGRHDDGALRDTAPDLSLPSSIGHESTDTSDPRLSALAEALYARSARGLALGEAVELARRTVEDDASVWTVLRSFVDAGWYDPVWMHGTIAQGLSPRRPRLLRRGDDLVLDGMVCEEIVEGLEASSKSLGGTFSTVFPSVVAALPVHVLTGLSPEDSSELGDRTRMGVEEPSWRTVPRIADLSRDRDTSLFEPFRRVFGIGRSDRCDGKGPPLWDAGGDGSTCLHTSRIAAILHRSEMEGAPAFVWADDMLRPVAPGHHLPASWGRWLRHRMLAGAGPTREGEGMTATYGYPCDRSAANSLSKVTGAVGVFAGHVPVWIERSSRAGRPARQVRVDGRTWGVR